MEKLVIVTGASRGIGAAIAHKLAADGYYVGCISRSGTLPATGASVGTAEQRLIPVAADVACPEDVCVRGASLRESAGQFLGLLCRQIAT